MADYFTVEEARALKPLDKQTGSGAEAVYVYTDEMIEAARAAAEQAIEWACGVAFTERTATLEPHDGTGRDEILLDHPKPVSVTACTVDGTALDEDGLGALVVYPTGVVYRPTGWTEGRGNVLVTYTHGWPAVPGLAKDAALKLTKWLLVDSPVSARATQMQTDDGTVQFFGQAAQREAFSVEEVNALIRLYGYGTGVA